MKKYRWNKKKFARNMVAVFVSIGTAFMLGISAYGWLILGW